MMQENKSSERSVNQQPQPGKKLSSDIAIILHTRIAQSLFNGSWKQGKMGLLQFANLILVIWNAAKNDDPYAEWYLLKTYQALFDAREKLKLVEMQLTPYLNNLRGITIGQCASIHPIQHPLNFSTPFGFMGAYLIADFDFVLRQHLMLERIGIPLKEDITIRQLVKLVQEAFSVPRQWKKTDVTRKDIIEHTQKSADTIKILGEVPAAILNREINFSFLPKFSGMNHD